MVASPGIIDTADFSKPPEDVKPPEDESASSLKKSAL
jgi:hypothetical protein